MTKKTKTPRDWYARKVSKAWQDYLNNKVKQKTFTKEEVRENNRKKTDKDQHQEAIGSLFNNELNYLINNQFVFVTNRQADPLVVVGDKYETVYAPIYLNRTDSDNSITKNLFDTFKDIDKFTKEIHFKRNYTTDPKWNNGWILREGEVRPELNLRSGGYVDIGSYRHLDHVEALLTAHEFVLSAPAVRGLGKGSYKFGARILALLMAHWIKEGKRYAHKR